MNKQSLATVALFLSAIGLAFVSIPFLSSLPPSEVQASKLPRASLSKLAPGHFMEIEGRGFRAFVIRRTDSKLRIFSVPYWEDKYRMPDVTWDRAWLPCDHFGPESDGSALRPDARFRCLDTNPGEYEWWKHQLFWTLDGDCSDPYFEQLRTPRYEIRGETVIIGKSA